MIPVPEGENPYIGRRVGISEKNQEKERLEAGQWWRGSKCPSCGLGFTARSKEKQCHSCDKYTHVKKNCISMGENNTVFLCKSCKPESRKKTTEVHTKTANGYECQVCSFKTSFKYSLKRHIDKQHGGNSQSSQEEVENHIEIEIAPVVESLETFRSHSIAQMLEKVGLSNLSIKFDEQGVDLDMLIGLNNDDMKECMKEVGINRFGDRHKILQQIQIEKRKNVSTEIIETIDTPDQSIIQESGESIENDCVGDLLDGTEEENEEANENESFDDQTNDNSRVECPLCRDSSQHCCRICGKPVCNLFCSVPDPRSDNESHRVHKHGDFRCITQQFECPSCGKTFAKPSECQEHMGH